MNPSPYHYLLPRHDYDQLARVYPDHLADVDVLALQDHAERLGSDSPVRLFFRSAHDYERHQRDTLRLLASLRTETLTPTT